MPGSLGRTVLLPIQALITFWPGAKISTTEPKLEKDARASAIVLAPTVMAEGARAGLVDAASLLSLPAATCPRFSHCTDEAKWCKARHSP